MIAGSMRPQPPALLLDLGRRVAELRRARGLTQEKFAERADVSVGYVREIETGRENLGLLSLAKIAGHLNVTVPDLLVPPVSRTVRRGRPPRVPAPSSSPAAATEGQTTDAKQALEQALRQAASLAQEQASSGDESAAAVGDVVAALAKAIKGAQGQARSKSGKASAELLSKARKLARNFLAEKPTRKTERATATKRTSRK